MRRRIVLSTALIAFAAVIVLGVPLGLVEAARVRQDNESRLEREADGIAAFIDDRVEARRPILPQLLRRAARGSHRIVVRLPDGSTVESRPELSGDVLRAHAGSRVAGTVVAEAPTGELDRRVARAWLLIAALGAAGVATAVALAAMQARRLARPLETIARRSAQLGDGDFSVRIGHVGVPEFDAIARGLDGSAGRIAELVAREREFSANVSHQLRTPLTALRLRLEEIEASTDADDRAREIEAAFGESDRLEATMTELLAYARREHRGELVAVNLAGVAHEHAARWRPMLARAGRGIEVATARNVVVRASRGTVGQVLDVLAENALRHGRGAVRVTVEGDDDVAMITVADEGPGIPVGQRERIFDRGASATGGTGIGLHLARLLAEADGGALHVADGPPTRFLLRLPTFSPDPNGSTPA